MSEPRKFSNIDEKRDYLEMAACEWTIEKLSKPLPCAMANCLNLATAGSMSYNQTERAWIIQAVCKSCATAIAKVYSDEPTKNETRG